MNIAEGQTSFGFSIIVVIVVASVGAYNYAGSTAFVGENTKAITSTTNTWNSSSGSPAFNYNFSRYGLVYVSDDPGCSVSYQGGPWHPSACLGLRADAIVFNCATSAATSQGCTQTVYIKGTTNESLVVRVWYPYVNKTNVLATGTFRELPWQNCQWFVLPPSGPSVPAFAYCISLNSTSFLIAQPSGPPT